MAKIMQNMVVLVEPPERAWNTSSKGPKMCLNRFCIDEDAAFELSGVHHVDKSFNDMDSYLKEASKGKEFSYGKRYRCFDSLHSYKS